MFLDGGLLQLYSCLKLQAIFSLLLLHHFGQQDGCSIILTVGAFSNKAAKRLLVGQHDDMFHAVVYIFLNNKQVKQEIEYTG